MESKFLCLSGVFLFASIFVSVRFHVDELLAIAMLRMLKKYENADIARSRDPKIWSLATVLVDVGDQNDPKE